MKTIHICKATPAEKNQWDTFVDENMGSFFHYYGWNDIFSHKKWESIQLIARNETDQILGIFPLYLIKRHCCKLLKSLPEGASGGMVIKNTLASDEKKQVADAFLTYMDKDLDVSYHRIDISENLTYEEDQETPVTHSLRNHGYHQIKTLASGLPSTFILPLSAPFEEKIWKEQWNGNLRNNIRKAQRQKVTVIQDTTLTYETEFIQMMHQHYQRMQTPSLSDEELHQRLHVFPNKTRLFVALHNNKPIAFLLCYYTPSTVFFSKLPHDFEARKYQTNALICYHGIKHACEQGYSYVEFGLTFNKNQARWKSKFKGKQIPIRHFQKRPSSSHCLYYDVMDHLAWNFRNRKSLWDEKDKIKKRLINQIKK